MQTKKVRLYINGERQKDIRPNMTKWQIFLYKVKRFFKVLFWGIMVTLFLVGVYELGNYYGDTKVIYTKQEVIKEVPIKASVLERIAKCESPTGHWKDGQVVMSSNTNHSVDIGKYQINNKAWGKKATELGYNLVVEKDNEAMAQWIYTNRGTEDWYSSKSCWMK